MENSKLFQNIWRFNAVVIATAGVLAIIGLVFGIFVVYKQATRDRHTSDIVNIDPNTNIEQRFRFGRMQHIKGSKSVLVPLYSDQKFSIGVSSNKSSASTRNLLFINLHTEANKWLFPNNDFLIVTHQMIRKTGNYYDENEDVVANLYHIVKTDSNNDSRLTDSDKFTLALSNPYGENYAEVLHDIDHALNYELLDKNTIAFMYDRNTRYSIAYISLKDFSIIKQIELAQIPH